jgi:putative membrane protein
MGDYFDLVADRFGLPRVPAHLSRREAQAATVAVAVVFHERVAPPENQRAKKELRARCAIPVSRMAMAAAWHERKPPVLIVKVLHLWLVVSWFAGLFYLPRIFVNLAMVPADSVAERDRLLLMAGKLYRFMTPIGCWRSLITGLWLWFGFGFSGGWLHAKTTLVVGCSPTMPIAVELLHATFQTGRNVRSHVWFRWFNEMPVLLLLAVTYARRRQAVLAHTSGRSRGNVLCQLPARP